MKITILFSLFETSKKEFNKRKLFAIKNRKKISEGFLNRYPKDESEKKFNEYITKLQTRTLFEILDDGDVGFKRFLEYTDLYDYVENIWVSALLYDHSECDSAESIEKKLKEKLKTLIEDIANIKKIVNSSDKEKSDANLSKNFSLPENLDNN